jgi:hypothetical protein
MERDIPATSVFASAKVSVTNNPKHILGLSFQVTDAHQNYLVTDEDTKIKGIF